MTPEERLRLLRDREQWTFTLKAREDAVPARAPWSPWVVSLATIAAVAIVGVITFSVFGLGIRAVRPVAPPVLPPSSATPTPTSTPTASPTPDPTKTEVAVVPSAIAVPQPKQLFDGDCNAIYTDAQLSALTGEKMELYTPSGVTNQYGGQLIFALEQAGGLSCAWGVMQEGGGYDSGSTQVNFFVLPESAAKPLAQEETCGPPYSEGMGQYVCGIEHVASGIRFSGGVQGATKAESRSLSATVIAHLNARAAAVDSSAPVPAKGAWSNPVDCPALNAKLDVTGVFGEGATFGTNGLGHGSYGPPVGREITTDYESLSCSANVPNADEADDYYEFGIMGGGSWVRDELAQFPTVSIAGVSDAWKVGDYLYVITGPNVITLRYYDVADDTYDNYERGLPQLKALIEALDAM